MTREVFEVDCPECEAGTVVVAYVTVKIDYTRGGYTIDEAWIEDQDCECPLLETLAMDLAIRHAENAGAV